MTKFQALFVKLLRVKQDCSWRSVAAHYYNRYDREGNVKPMSEREDFKYFTYGGNQIDGIQLCEEAMNLLDEKVEDGWN